MSGVCDVIAPPLAEWKNGHRTACHLYDDRYSAQRPDIGASRERLDLQYSHMNDR